MNCLPFIIALIVYVGSIIIHIIELASYKKRYSSIQPSIRYKTLCGSNALQKAYVNSHIGGIVVSLIIITLTYVLCSKNKENWAWLIIITPFIVGFIAFLMLINKVSNLRQKIVNIN